MRLVRVDRPEVSRLAEYPQARCRLEASRRAKFHLEGFRPVRCHPATSLREEFHQVVFPLATFRRAGYLLEEFRLAECYQGP